MVALLASTPALPLDEAGKYVAGAYVVFVVLLVVYVAIMAAKLGRMEKELRELAGFAEQAQGSHGAGARAAAPGREAEEVAVDETQPPTGSDRNLTPSESVGGPAEPVQGVPDV
jgi:Flp pilus assembly protein TadB